MIGVSFENHQKSIQTSALRGFKKLGMYFVYQDHSSTEDEMKLSFLSMYKE
jgi:hypothetical protein